VKLSVIIPVYNEENNIQEVLKAVNKVSLDKEIIVVDDASTDTSLKLLKKIKQPNLKVIHHSRNQGKGAAIRTGIKNATGDIILIQDADLEYEPNDYKKLLKPIMQGKAEITFGSRFPKRARLLPKKGTMHPVHWIGNNFLTLLFNTLYGTNLTDAEPCYKMFKSDILKAIEIYNRQKDSSPITAQ